LIPHEQRWVDSFEGYKMATWYTAASIRRVMITHGAISMGGLSFDEFWVQRIERIPNGYRVAVTWNTEWDWHYRPADRSERISLPSREEAQVFDLFFFIDGDYIDVYYAVEPDGSDRTFSASFARIDYEMRRQLSRIILIQDPSGSTTHFFEPTKLTFWPRRADGSMDFPHNPLTVPENSMPVFVFEDTVVLVPPFEAPAEPATSAYTPDVQVEHDPQSVPVAEEQTREGGIPLWALLVIIGAIILTAGGVILFAARRRSAHGRPFNPLT